MRVHRRSAYISVCATIALFRFQELKLLLRCGGIFSTNVDSGDMHRDRTILFCKAVHLFPGCWRTPGNVKQEDLQ